ncbi:DUF6377 domain-containing protein [Marinilabilia rubra]|uniref:DUF6377 domain-containing protein n=1 Tax=Marinilabilia rubra TaxID=2162893 RepID=A0A2U2B994_9BACT|nr:DUF6377 domain-containing protein [Marinilabilia rubra]PWD99638.1 hypothetical protein DDZ16_09330 [Marinilabilia rubra]
MSNTSIRVIIVLFSVFTASFPVSGQKELNAVLDSLDQTLENKEAFDKKKENKIQLLKELEKEATSLEQSFDLNHQLYEEYRKYQLDSATVYARACLKVAEALNNNLLKIKTKIHLVPLYASSGRFIEAEDLLESINKNSVPRSLLPDYYKACHLFFNYYAANVRLPYFLNKTKAYRDSVMKAVAPESPEHQIYKAETLIDKNNLKPARDILEKLLNTPSLEKGNYAVVTFWLGIIHSRKGNAGESKRFFAMSAISDIRHSTKDNSSLHHLASLFNREGNIEKAFKYSQAALNDALFSNVQFRAIYLSEFFSIINDTYKERADNQKNNLILYIVLISFLSLFLIVAVIYVYRQMDKTSGIRKELDKANKELVRLNADILQKNDQLYNQNHLLQDSNQIKEEYIAHFFDLCSTYINKLDDYRKSLNKKANTGSPQDLIKALKSSNIVEDELEELYRNFDTIFLNLYPSFIEEYNELLADGEKVEPKPGEKLNTELRIFALIRLGITDSVKIAAFLRYSLSTIYNYRTKARNKASVSREEFEDLVMKIGTLGKR